MSNESDSRAWVGAAATATLVAVAVLVCCSVAAGQDRWLVLPSSSGDGVDAEGTSRVVADALVRGLRPQGVTMVDPGRARELYEQRGSTAPVMFDHSDLDALAQDTQMALYHVASGLPARARQDVERALTRANRVLESLNRESLAAQQLLDACLFLVRAHMQAGRRVAAREQALECRRLVPDIEPDGTTHPPDVIGLLAEAEAHLRVNEPGALRVESDPSGCPVYVNGRRLGTAPLELSQLGPGEYRVQAECVDGHPGRVHRVQIQATRVTVRIDTALDDAVRTGGALALRYASARREAAMGAEHAVNVARVTGATHVLWVKAASASAPAVELQLLRVADAQRIATARATVDGQRGVDVEAIRAALATGSGRGDAAAAVASETSPVDAVDPVGSDDVPVIDASPAADADPTRSGVQVAGDSTRWLAPTVAIVGAGTLLVAWGLWTRHYLAEERHARRVREGGDHAATLRDVDGSELTHVFVGAAGAAVTAVSIPLLDLPQARAGWWAATFGVLGVGTLGAGIALTVSGASCDEFDSTPEGRCTDTLANSRLGPMLAVSSLPLLSLPLTYLLQAETSGGMAVQVKPRGQDGLVLLLGGML